MDPDVRTVLEVLGDGGTTDMAHRVLTWIGSGGQGLGVRPADIIDRKGIAGMLGVSRQQLAKLIADDAMAFPAPFHTLTGGEQLFDVAQVQRWRDGHPDIGGGTETTR